MKTTVAVCDILGFSKIVEEISPEIIVDEYLGWLRKSLHHSIHKNDFPNEIPSLKQLESHDIVRVSWFSDTIFLYTIRDTDDALQSLISTVGWLLFESTLASRNLRCGIAYGEAHMDSDEGIFIGHPIIEAYRLEQVQAWAGGALALSAIDRLPKDVESGEFADWWLVPYEVPRSGGGVASKLAINWTFGLHRGFDVHWSSSSPVPSDEDLKNKPKIVEKWQNTKKFHDKVCKHCENRS